MKKFSICSVAFLSSAAPDFTNTFINTLANNVNCNKNPMGNQARLRSGNAQNRVLPVIGVPSGKSL